MISHETAFGMCAYNGVHGDAQWRDDETLTECVERLMGVKIIPKSEALKLLSDTDEAADVSGFGMIPVVRIAEPFKLVIVDGGSGGPDGEPGDYIGLHPNGYPMVIARAVAERAL